MTPDSARNLLNCASEMPASSARAGAPSVSTARSAALAASGRRIMVLHSPSTRFHARRMSARLLHFCPRLELLRGTRIAARLWRSLDYARDDNTWRAGGEGCQKSQPFSADFLYVMELD